MSFQLGQIAGGYEFLEVLGSSKGEVAFKVRNHLSQRLEALKVLPHSSADDRERVERFLREIKVHAGLQHPNIVTFYNAAELEGQLVMTTELVEGITLAERMQAGPLRWSEVVSHMTQVLLALGYAHEHGIVHRNVTPENIIITPDATVKLTGFGLAKPLAAPNLTQTGFVLGELKYISPEQIKGSSNIDARADLYSAGVVMYEALTGRLPFEFDSQFQVMMAHANADPLPASEAAPGVPPEFDPILLMALSKDPAARLETADLFRAHLENIAESLRSRPHASSVGARPEPAPAVPESEQQGEPPELVASRYENFSDAPGSRDLVPTFGVIASTGLGQRQMIALGVFALLIGMLIAVLLAVIKV
ncbi:MAG TPA: serine/threonine-protein kinase [Bryobacteraceae bacterium]|nr:serine/threonine-protein kinase [Bryobacteraceae bacterium]